MNGKWRTLIAVALLLFLLSGCGTPPSQEVAQQTETPLPSAVMPSAAVPSAVPETAAPSTAVPSAAASSAPDGEADYATVTGEIRDVHLETLLYDVTIDAVVEQPETQTLPDVWVAPRDMSDFQPSGGVPEGWSTHASGSDFSKRFDFNEAKVDDFEWEPGSINRWDSVSDYTGTLTEAEAVETALAWAADFGIEDAEVAEVRAYGKETAANSFLSVWLRTRILGIPVSMEEFQNIAADGRDGLRAIVYCNDEGEIRMYATPVDLASVEENNAPLLSLEEALRIFEENLDTQCRAPEGSYTIRRIAVEYVPVEREGEAERLVPCWTFSSGINYRTNMNLVFWVDARTGEVV